MKRLAFKLMRDCNRYSYIVRDVLISCESRAMALHAHVSIFKKVFTVIYNCL
jgi:hypothetical protein